MLKIVQPHHQTHRLGRSAIVLTEMIAQGALEGSPVDLSGQADQWMVGIDDGFELDLEQVVLEVGVAAGTGSHEFAGFLRKLICFTENNYTHSGPICTDFIGLSDFFIDDYIR